MPTKVGMFLFYSFTPTYFKRMIEISRASESPIFDKIAYRVCKPVLEKPGFIGIPDKNARGLYLLRQETKEKKRGQFLVIQNTARLEIGPAGKKRPYIGHMKMYQDLVAQGASVNMLPVNEEWLSNCEMLEEVVFQADIVVLCGGKHLGPKFLSSIQADPTASQFGNYDDVADALDNQFVSIALQHPEVFVIAVCRGFEEIVATLTQLPPRPIKNHAPTPPSEEMVMHPVKNVFKRLYGCDCPITLPHISQVNSYHQQGYPLASLDLKELSEKGWFVTHISPTDEVVEMMVRLDLSRLETPITAITTQFHPERLDSAEGAAFRKWSREVSTHRE